jgi:hypothetical protein
MQQDDRTAVMRFLMPALTSGVCKAFRDGATVIVTDLSLFGGPTQVRERGEPDEYWMPRPMVNQ